jgi:hypothetical protein
MYTEQDTRTLWQRRAAAAGFIVWHNRTVSEMQDVEIEAAFIGLRRAVGIHYAWGI